MRWSKERDGERISTPIYLGTTEAVAKQASCSAHHYTTTPIPPQAPEGYASCAMHIESCIHCGAHRTRITGPEVDLVKLFTPPDPEDRS